MTTLDEPGWLAAEHHAAYAGTEPTVPAGTANGAAPNPLVERLEAATYIGDRISDVPPPEPLVAGMLNLDSLAVLYGPSGQHKSFLAIDWALSVATGSWWHGRAVTAGAVVYVAAEGSSGLGARKDAWLADRRLCNLDKAHPIYWVTQAVNLYNPTWTAALVEFCAKRQPRLVVLDTLARNMVGAEENSAKDIGVVIDNADHVRRATGACVLPVHHAGKDVAKGARGSTALKGGLDTEIECSASEDVTVVKVVKQKNGRPPAPIKLHLVEIGDSCVLADRPDVDETKLTERAAALLDLITEVDMPGGHSVSALREMASEHSIQRTTFFAHLKTLVDAGLVFRIGQGRGTRYTTTPPEDGPT